MAKKKSKKESEKKDKKKNLLARLKISKKKASKKKDKKKKDKKKKDKKKKESKLKKSLIQETGVERKAKEATTVAESPSEVPEDENGDHSSNYNVLEATKKLKTLKSKDDLMAFVNGEKRITVTKAIPAALSKLK